MFTDDQGDRKETSAEISIERKLDLILEQIQGNTIVDDVAGRLYPHLVQIEAEFRHEAGPVQ